MKPKLEFQKVLVLSTIHLNPERAHAMNRGRNPTGLQVDCVDYGYMVYVGLDLEGRIQDAWPGCPEDLQPAFQLAMDDKADWIRFDRDGPIVEGLPVEGDWK